MNKFIVTLIAGLFASAAFAQAPAVVTPAAKSAQSEARTVKADAAPLAAGAQAKAVKHSRHHAKHHAKAKAKAHQVLAKADTKAIAPQ